MPETRKMISGCLLPWVLLCCVFNCRAFNLDILNRVTHTSPQLGSWFGFSVAMYKHDNINTLLVGAPKYNTTQPEVQRGGAVLRCSVEHSNRICEYVPFDNQSHMRSDIGYFVDSKNNQFFGATLKSKNGIVLACAPRYIWFTASRRKREPVGTCYVARQGMTDFQEFSPCRTDAWGYHRQGSCQAGFDAALANDGQRIYIGAPGAFYWQGQIHSQSIVKNEYFTTGEGPADEDDQYLGYSVATGHFTEDDIQDVALGVPKGLNYTGKVVLYSHDLVWLQNITGDQLGSYFGYCLSVADFNGDGFDDIVVGAPMYTDYKSREMKIEVGKVHVLLQNNAHTFRRQVTYLGTVDRGRFGLSVASLGDINLDGFEDFAVGAPYGGKDGRGTVFIYHGFATTDEVIRDEMKIPIQVIYSSEVGGLSTFGWSLAGGIDVDENAYPDLLVGAYEAEKILLFKSRPIIKFLEHKLEFKSEGKSIDIKNQNCEIKRGHFFSCIDLVFCLTYTGVNVDDNIELEVEYHLDMIQSSEQRLLFVSNEQGFFREKIQYLKEIQRCRNLKTFLKPGLVDKLTPISANVSYSLIEHRRLPRFLSPVLDRGQNLSMGDALDIQNNCGEDNICIPDLVLTVEGPDEFIIGQKEMLNLSVRVMNNREDAFETAVYISEPKGLLFNKFERRENASCSVRKVGENSFLKCDIGNPLPMHEGVFFNVLFQQSGQLEEPKFDFLINVNSTNKEDETSEDNEIRKVVEAKLQAQLTLFGSSDPESITYNTSLYRVPVRSHEDHAGPSLVHKYGLLNSGPSDVKRAEIVILWPTKTLAGKYLLYLIEEPITVGKIKCDPVPDINPLNLKKISAEERVNILQLENIGGSHRISSAQVDRSRSQTSSPSFSSSSSISSSSSQRTQITSLSSSAVNVSSSSRREGTLTSSSTGGSWISSQSGGRRREKGYSYSPSAHGGDQGKRVSSSSHAERGYEYTSRSGTSSSGGGGGIYSSHGRSGQEGSYFRSSTGQRGHSTFTGGEGGSYSSSSGNKTETDHSSTHGGVAGTRSSSARGGEGAGGSYSNSERETETGYPSSAHAGAEESYSSSSGSEYSTSTGDRAGGRGYSSYGVEEREGPYSYSSHSQRVGQDNVDSRSSGGSGYHSSSATGRRTYLSGSGGYESSSDASLGAQRGPILPSSGTGGRFASTLFTVQGGGAGSGVVGVREAETSSSSSRTEDHHGHFDYGSASVEGQHAGRSREAHTSSQKQEAVYSSSSRKGGISGGGEGGSYSSSSSRRENHYSSSSGGGSGDRLHFPSGDSVSDVHRSTGDGGEEGKYYSSSYYERHSPGHSGSSSSSSSSSSYSHKSSSSSYPPDEEFYRQNEIDSRTKRDVGSEEEWDKMVSECGATLCTRIRCTTEELTANDDVYIYIRSRLWVDTLNEDPKFQFPVDDVTITTRMLARADVTAKEIPSDVDIPSDEKEVYSQNVVTPIRSVKSWEEGPSIPWWVILLATLAGILILLIIILILWKLGFFKRQRAKGSSS